MYSCHVYMHYCTEESLHVKISLYTMYMHSWKEEREERERRYENELYSYCFIWEICIYWQIHSEIQNLSVQVYGMTLSTVHCTVWGRGHEIDALHWDRRQAHSSAHREKENLIWSNCLMKGQGPQIHGWAAVGEETLHQNLIPTSLMSDCQELCNRCNGRLMQGTQLIDAVGGL